MRGSYSQQAVINVKLDMFVPRAEELFLKTKPALKLKGFIPLTGELFLKNGKCKITEVSLSLVRGSYSRGVACGLDNIPFVLRTEELFLAKLPNFAQAIYDKKLEFVPAQESCSLIFKILLHIKNSLSLTRGSYLFEAMIKHLKAGFVPQTGELFLL